MSNRNQQPEKAASALPDRLLPLDSLRGLAALGIAALFHYQHFDYATPPVGTMFDWFVERGSSLVDLFFVLSGFLFMYLYFSQIKNRQLSFSYFLWKRLSRLYPLHLVTTLTALGLHYRQYNLYGHNELFLKDLPLQLLYNLSLIYYGVLTTVNYFKTPSWTISLEVVCYILFFVAVALLRRRPLVLLAFTGLVVLGLCMQPLGFEMLVFNEAVGRALLGFFAGCLVQVAYAALKIWKPSPHLILFGSILAIVVGTQFAYDGNNWNPGLTLLVYPAIIFLSLLFKPLTWILSFTPFVYLGLISYSIYL